jgi:hypothetical protein
MTGKGRARIAFERSGGFAGISVRTDVDIAELPEDEAEEYRSMLTGLDLAALARPPVERAGQPDRFQYDISIEQGDQVYQMSYGENELPEQLQPLVRRLTKRATARRG